MTGLRVVLLLWFIVMVAYTGMVIAADGMDFLTPFTTAVAHMGWEGQFSLDLAGYLLLTLLWILWRDGFTARGLLVATLVVSAGVIGLCSYLLLSSLAARGDMKVLLIGKARAGSA